MKGLNSNKIFGELYLDENNEVHFICHTSEEMTFEQVEDATKKFIELLQGQLDNKKKCPFYRESK